MALAELHLHLEGSVEPDSLCALEPGLTAAEIGAAYEFTNFAGFLDSFKWVARKLRSPADYSLIATHLCQRLLAENVTYAEITLAAGVVLWKKQDLAAILEAAQRAASQSGIAVQWNLDAIRQFGPDQAWPVAEFAAANQNAGVVSFGIGGDELTGPAEWFSGVYKYAKEQGLRLTAHAGETAGPESIWAALEIGAERIGHGIRAIDDPLLVRHLAEHRIPLEVCITSNVKTGAVASLAEHPVRRLFDAGVPITLSTDDPAIFRTTLAREFALAAEHFGFTESELSQIRQNAWDFRFSRQSYSG